MKRLCSCNNTICFVRYLRQRAPIPLKTAQKNKTELPPIRSLQSIREQINLANTSARITNRDASQIEGDQKKSLPSPNDFYDPFRFREGMKIRKRILQEKIFNDSDEVLRKKNKSDTMKYINIAFHGSHSLPPLQDLRRVLEKVEHIHASLTDGEKNVDTDDRSLWIEALYTLSDDELQVLWSSGFLDFTILEEMLLSDTKKPTEDEAFSESLSSVPLKSYLTERHSNIESVNSISERIAYFKKLRSYSELTQSIHETALTDAPTVDIAPTVEKVLKKQFEDISEEELLRLQKYEEVPSVLLSTLDDNRKPHVASVTEAMLNRIVLPSNAFLAAVSEYDHSLKKSMDVLERTKRHSLLDTSFQEAIHNARDMEGEMDPFDTKNNTTMSEKRKLLGGYKGSKDPFSRTHFATDIPLFYGARQSVVPPHGRYGLPSPRIPKETRRILRRRKRASYARFRR